MNLRSIPKRNWIFYSAFAAGYAVLGLLTAYGYSQYSSLIVGILFIGIIPSAITLTVAVPFAYYYVQIHKKVFNPNPPASSYEPITTIRPQVPRLRTVARSTVITNFGILHLIISVVGLSSQFQLTGAGFGFLLFGLIFAIFLSPSLNIASWLLTRTGVMYENRIDGTRINIGKDLRTRLEYAIGPLAALNFFRVILTSGPDFSVGLGFIVVSLVLSIPTVFVTILLLRPKALQKMSTQLNEKLKSP